MRPVEIPIHRPLLDGDELERVREVFDSRWLGSGPMTREFEDRVGALVGASHTIATASCTAALRLALAACGVSPGDEVIVPSLTYVACSQAIAAAGCRPVYCDVELATATLAVASAAERVGPRTRAIMPVDYGGFPCRLDEIGELARDRGLMVVEDAAHAFGSSYGGRAIGSIGDFTCFSFDPLKNVTCGEGGAVTTASDDAAARIRTMRGLGIAGDAWNRRTSERPWFHEAVTEGFRFHLSDINAAIGLAQLDRLDERRSRRRQVVHRYRDGLQGLEGLTLLEGDVDGAYPFLCAARALDGRRDALVRALRENGIQAWMHYVPNHLQPAFATAGAELPVTEQLYGELVSFPLYHELSDDDVDRVVAATRSFLGAGS